MKSIIAVVGDSTIEPNGDKFKLATELGKVLVDNGYRVQTGGRGGIMEAAFIGAKMSKKYTGNENIAVSPFFNKKFVNPHADIVINTGVDLLRNTIVVTADAVVAIGGGAGTLAEMANAWTMGKLVIGYDNVEGSSARMANAPIDHRKRYENIPDDRVYGVKTAADVIKVLNENINRYDHVYRSLMDKL